MAILNPSRRLVDVYAYNDDATDMAAFIMEADQYCDIVNGSDHLSLDLGRSAVPEPKPLYHGAANSSEAQ